MRWTALLLGFVLVFVLGGLVQGATVDFQGATVNLVNAHSPAPDSEFGHTVRMAEEQFNVEIQFIPLNWATMAEEFMARILAGESQYDLWHVDVRFFYEMFGQGAFYPLNDLFSDSYWAELSDTAQARLEGYSVQGVAYGLPQPWAHIRQMVAMLNLVLYNKDLLEREGLPDLFQLYRDGDWTWERMQEIAVQATKDTSGDGAVDQWGISMLHGHADNLVAYAVTNGADVVQYDEAGNGYFALGSDAAMEAFAFLNELWAVHGAMTEDWGGPKFIAGQSAMTLKSGAYALLNVNDNMEDAFGIVPLPKGPRVDEHIHSVEAAQAWCLPANSAAPEKMIALHDFLFAPAYPEELDESVNEWILRRVRDRNSANVIRTMAEEWNGEVPKWFGIYGPRPVSWDVFQAITHAVEGAESPAAAMASVASLAQSIIDDVLGQ